MDIVINIVINIAAYLAGAFMLVWAFIFVTCVGYGAVKRDMNECFNLLDRMNKYLDRMNKYLAQL